MLLYHGFDFFYILSMTEKIHAVMRQLEQLTEKGNNFWNISPTTGKFLNILLKVKKVKTALEVGTSNGYSALWFAEALSHTGGKLYTIESHEERFLLAQKTFQEAGVGSFVEQIKGHAPEVFSTPSFQNRALSFEFIFLDATKMEYAAYFQSLLPLLCPGGLLVADNVISHRAELGAFFQLLTTHDELDAVEIPLGSGLMLFYKAP